MSADAVPAAREVPLAGGNSNRVVRLGDTVRRRIPPGGAAVHELLTRLHAAGFTACPRFLGVDEQGREVLGYVEGVPGLHPFTDDVRSERALVESTLLVRRFHDHTAALTDLPGPWPGESTLDLPVQVVCHGDLAPYNIVYRGRSPVGIIDFDNARPGARIEDVAYFAYRFAPLSAERNYPDGGWPRDVDRLGRLRTIVRTYGGDQDYGDLPDLVVHRLAELVDWIRVRAERGDPAVAVHLAEDHMGIYAADIAWVRANAADLRAAVAG